LADGEFAIADVGLRHHGVTVDAAHEGVKARVELVDARQGGRQRLATGDLPGVDRHAQGRGVEVQQWDGGAWQVGVYWRRFMSAGACGGSFHVCPDEFFALFASLFSDCHRRIAIGPSKICGFGAIPDFHESE